MEDIRQLEERIRANPTSIDPNLIYKVANYYFINHNLDEALKYYNLLLKVDPNHKMGLFELGSIYSNIGNLNEAINLWQKVVSIDPQFIRAHFNLALAYSKVKRYSDALSELQITLSLARQSGDPVGLEKRILQEIKRIQDIQAGISSTDVSQDIETQRQYALILHKRGDLDGALQAFKEILNYVPNDLTSLLNVGIIHYKKKEYEEALKYLQKVIDIKPNDHEAYSYIARVYEETGNYQEAIDYYKKAISYNPNDYFSYYRLGRILYSIGSYEEAIKYYKKSVELNPLDSYSHNNLGIAYLEAGNVTEAIKHFLKSTYLDPNDSYSYFNLAKAYVKLGQLNRAYKSIHKAIQLEQKPVYLLEAAKILYKLRNYKESLVFAVKATEMDSNLFDAYILISKLYTVAKKYDEGISILEKFASIERPNLLLELAHMYYTKGEIEKSISILKNILSQIEGKNKDIVLEATRRLVRIYCSLGRYEEAYEYSENMISQYFLDKEDYLLLISIYLNLSKYSELLSLISRINIDENDMELLFYYSYCCIKVGIYDVANKYLQKLYSLYPYNLKICYYYFYSLLKTSNYELAKDIFDKIEEEIFKDPSKYDDLYENYMELLFMHKKYDFVIQKGINFVNSSDLPVKTKERIVEFIFRSLYENRQLNRIGDFENLIIYATSKARYIFLLSLLMKRDYEKLRFYVKKFEEDLDAFSEDSEYVFIYIVCLLKLGDFDRANVLYQKYSLSHFYFLVTSLLFDIYNHNLAEMTKKIKSNISHLYNFYVILGIRYGFISKEEIELIWDNLSRRLRDLWKIYTFDYKNIDENNFPELIGLVNSLKIYTNLEYEDIEYIYFLPDDFVEYYFYNPIYLFFHMITLNIEDYMLEEEWDKINIFRRLNYSQKKELHAYLEELINSMRPINDKYYHCYISAKYSILFGNLDKAISLLFESLNYRKYSYSARLLLGGIYYLREMYDLAIEQLMEIYHEDNETVRFMLGKNYLASKSFKLADEEFSYLVNLKPDSYKYLYYKVLTNVYMMNFKVVETLESLYNNIRIEKDVKRNEFQEISLYLAYVYILMKKYKEAEEILLDLLNNFPSNEKVYKYLSIVYISMNQIAKVLNVYNMGIKNIPYSSELYSQRGLLYYKANKFDLAEKDFWKAYQLNSLDFVAISHLGLISMKKEDYNSALNYFTEAISIKPLAYEIYTNIGNVYEKIGKIIEAREYYEIAYEHNPSNPQNIKKLIETLKKLSDTLKLQMIKEEIEKNSFLDARVKHELISLIGG
ncbi:MAG: tetratricopeptide repeat protein [bacterium]|nr:tetratricopeptide repeat protein [bacterium]